jgi:hypothetical protein
MDFSCQNCKSFFCTFEFRGGAEFKNYDCENALIHALLSGESQFLCRNEMIWLSLLLIIETFSFNNLKIPVSY